MIHDVSEKTIENLQSRIDLWLDTSGDELIDKVNQILPDEFVLLVLHGALDFYSQGTNFMDNILWPINTVAQNIQQLSLDDVTGLITEAHPQVLVVVLVLGISSINVSNWNVSPKNNSGKRLNLWASLALWVQDVAHNSSVSVRILKLKTT